MSKSRSLANLMSVAPPNAALDTLKELSTALNDDANFGTTVTNAIAAKQNTLVSGTNIKTVNGASLLGSGNITVGSTEATTSTPGTVYGFTQNNTYSTGLNGYGNTIVGYGAYANGNYQNTRQNFVGGVNAYATSYEGISIGYNAKVEASTALAIGANARVWSNANSSAVVGNYASAGNYAYQSTVVGSNAFTNSYVYAATVVGYYSKGYGNYSTTIGAANDNRGTYSIVAGYSNNSYANSILCGYGINDNGYSAIVLKNNSNNFSVPSDGFYVPTITSATTSNILYYNNANGKITYGAAPSGSGGGALNDLSDVTISGASNGQVLTYSNGTWINATPSSGGGTTPAGGYTTLTAAGNNGLYAEYYFDNTTAPTNAVSGFTSIYNALSQYTNGVVTAYSILSKDSTYYSFASVDPISYMPFAVGNMFSFQGYMNQLPAADFSWYPDNTMSISTGTYANVSNGDMTIQYAVGTALLESYSVNWSDINLICNALNNGGFTPTINVVGYSMNDGGTYRIIFGGISNLQIAGTYFQQLSFDYTTATNVGSGMWSEFALNGNQV